MTELRLVDHLLELRRRLLSMLAFWCAAFLPLVVFSKQIYSLLATPLLQILPAGAKLITIDVPAPFMVPIKLSLLLALFIALPFMLWQLWLFILPALYPRERKLALPLLLISTVLFYLGAAFAYLVVLPIALQFFVGFAPDGVQVMTDAGRYIDFVLTMVIAFGCAFLLPVALVLLVASGFLELQALRRNRAYVLIGAFVVGMILTPPDVISQTLLAVPLLLLYELGICCCLLLRIGRR